MAVKLRLKRMGKKRQPVYKVVAADARSPRDGRFIESIGLYNPKTDPAVVDINEERALYWLGVGAQPTDTVKNLLSVKGILLKQNLIKKGVSEEKMEVQLAEWNKLKEAKAAALAQKKEKANKAKIDAKSKAKVEVKADEEESVSVPEAEGTAPEDTVPEEKAE